ncbi:TetR/AcrR family transcriptional regulator [Nocardioides solisilvae]|uniref:TetR/AcrR family transcriptional regulator n=1 Tax=Nocardioides solisilvae TaxID=1542435 RepID=UPI000D750607|nr:TetR/AcrR family transcriptional regulator [Nocardioides solisilvae]
MTEDVTTVEVSSWRAADELELPPILAASRDAFYEAGYHGTSVRDIARRVGVTVPALYYHYENKEALLLAILDASINHLTALCRAAVEEAGPKPVDRFLNLVECIALFEANAGRTASVDREARLLPADLRAAYTQKRRAIEELLLSAVEAGVEAGVFDTTDARDTTRAILGMLQGIPVWFRVGGELSPEAVAARYQDICAHTVGASPAVIRKVRERARD